MSVNNNNGTESEPTARIIMRAVENARAVHPHATTAQLRLVATAELMRECHAVLAMARRVRGLPPLSIAEPLIAEPLIAEPSIAEHDAEHDAEYGVGHDTEE